MTFESDQIHEIPNPHNFGEYTFAPWVAKIEGQNIKVLNPNRGLRLAICYNLNSDQQFFGEIQRNYISEKSEEEHALVLKSLMAVCDELFFRTIEESHS